MAKRPGMKDIADAAGVSISTVDRVLNGREAVRKDTAERVYLAAKELGYHATSLIRQRVYDSLPTIRLGVLLLDQDVPFYQQFRNAIEEAAFKRGDAQVQLDFRHVNSQMPKDFAEALSSFQDTVTAVCAVAMDHPLLTRATEDLRESGLHVVALLSEFAQGVRQYYIGSNNVSDGRVAGWLMSNVMRGGKVAVFVGGHRWHGHALRESGFRAATRELRPDLEYLEPIANFDAADYSYDCLRELLDRYRDLRGVYVAGGGRAGAIRALRESRDPGDVTLIMHESNAQTMDAMRDGYADMLLSTDIVRVADDVIDKLMALSLEGAPPVPGQIFHHSFIELPGRF